MRQQYIHTAYTVGKLDYPHSFRLLKLTSKRVRVVKWNGHCVVVRYVPLCYISLRNVRVYVVDKDYDRLWLEDIDESSSQRKVNFE